MSHTPPWVWFLLAYLIWQGIQALRPSSVSVWRALIVPALFIASSVVRIAQEPLGNSGSFLLCGATFAGFAAIPILLGRPKIGIDRQSGYIRRLGSPIPLLRNTLIFGLQYLAAVLVRLEPNRLSTLTTISHMISGATAGYFIGWTFGLLHHYRSAVELEGR